ncbi:MAG: diguanylate cyclase [Alphaproteobacteria bacterium]|nr:diguanylate cyclase [Alphaproteobacteria bacterium]MBU0798030.1 diguanylate cyclase [Alphaproteobacteria bacterium]MBU0887570.1 diguanylate cyclase [Alphaproteobacteria bacterium]MBU1814221.1 diguanylate cyclase [Alphaproteobacteria bacterium]
MKSSFFIDRMTLRLQLGLAIGMLTAVLVVLSALIVGSLSTRSIERSLGHDLESRALAMQEALDRGMFERYRDVVNMASLQTALEGGLGSPDALRTIVNRMQQTYPLYAWIGVISAKGDILAATKDILVGHNIVKRDWFVSALDGPFVGDVHDAIMLAKLLDDGTGEPLRFVDVAAPLYGEDGNVIGVLGAHLSWKWTVEQRDAILSKDDHEAQRSMMILDQNGRILMGGPFGQDMSHLGSYRAAKTGETGHRRETILGVDSLVAYRPTMGHGDYAGLGWIVLSVQPAEIALKQVDDLRYVIAGVGLMLAILAAFLGWAVAHRLSSPLEKLRDTAAALGMDPNESNLPRLFGSREMVDLSHALRGLVRRLRQAEGTVEQFEISVEQRVEEKTSELRESNRSLAELAERDPLTGLLNRRGLENRGARLFAASKIENRTVSALLLDIDRFKNVNDTYGHAAGDTVIQTVAWICLAESRSHDLVCRLGGEEIVIITRGDEAGALILAERLRMRVAETPIAAYGGNIAITVSLGCAVMRESDRDLMSVINRADEALYTAKRRGRNQSIAYSERLEQRASVG